ncbi:tonsoku-like protein [Anopheles nili]|uniref:tonsoku-like protein n=1 Tax=Anopheles nili TaxID=185578 RepID=UPI00237A1B2D|nr:tonsoku-like protein [Anopheles nili]
MDYNELKLIKRKTKYANEDNYVSLAETCLLLGELYKDREEPQRALNEYKLAAKAYEKLNRTMERGLAFRMVGEMHSMLGQFKEALKNVQAYMRAAQKEGNVKALQEAHVTVGRVFLHRAECMLKQTKQANAEADLDEAKKSFQTALTICGDLQGTVRKSELISMQAGSYLNLGITLDYQGKTDLAQESMERAIRLAKEADLFELLYTCYNAMALCSSKWESKGGGDHCGRTLRLLNYSLEVASRLSNRKSKMCQTLMLMANFFLKMDDFQSARQTLKRAYRLKTPVIEDAKRIASKLKVLVAMCRMEDELVTTEATNYKRRKELYEHMGDGACKLRNFGKAAGFYQRMLQCAEALGEADRQLLPCYVSLYLTYTDNCQYDQAIEYLWKEYNVIANDPQEAYHTLMKIAKLYERQKKSFFTIQNVYLRAREEAKKLQSRDLERVAIQRTIKLLRANCMDLMAEKLEKEAIDEGIGDLNDVPADSEELPDHSIEYVDFEPEEENEDGEEHNTPNVGDDIDLEVDLSGDSESEQDATMVTAANSTLVTSASKTRKRGKRFVVRRNIKGETQLHQAAIAGNKVLAEQLLDLGHSVNERDYAGWLPLHEACIHGHAEIVRLLLDRGAHLNDKGGTSCEGITPLHDACRNGHLEVIDILLDRGANATQRNDYGDSSLSMLEAWYEKNKSSLSASESTHHDTIRNRLMTLFDAAGIPISSPPTSDKLAPKSSSGKRKPPSEDLAPSSPLISPSHSSRSTATASSGYGSEVGTSSRHRNSIFNAQQHVLNSEESSSDGEDKQARPQKSSTGIMEYRNVMNAMRKSKLNDERSTSMSLSTQKRRQVNSSTDEEGIDDWLVDDMKQTLKKSRVSRDFLAKSSGEKLPKKRSSNSLTAPPSNKVNEDRTDLRRMLDDDTTARLEALVDSEDDIPIANGETPHLIDGKESAFNVLMNNSSKSFRRTQSRRNSSELRSSSFIRRNSNVQSSLLDAGFQRHTSPTLEEKENFIPIGSSNSTTPVKHSKDNVSQQKRTSSDVPPNRMIQVILDAKETFSVPYDEQLILTTQTIGWLRNEIAKQYMMKHGKRPTIKLIPLEGSTAYVNSFFDSDSLQVLLSNGVKEGASVHGQIHGWERINFDQFLDEYFQEHCIENDQELRKNLIALDRMYKIVLEPDYAYSVPSEPIPPVKVMSLLYMVIFLQQDCITHLDLSMNGITDEEMEKLVRYLPACKHLRVLRLRMNILTSRSVEMLCFGCKDPVWDADFDSSSNAGALGGGMLTELDLSHNPLQDGSLGYINRLCCNLPSLRILRLCSTDITNFLPTEQTDFGRLETIDISDNELTERSMHWLLQQLAEDKLREAHFNSLSVHCDEFKAKLWPTLSEHPMNGLHLLNLTNCRLTDDEIENSLLPAIGKNCGGLTRLDLSLNVALTKRSFLAIIKHCSDAAYVLKEVRFDHDVQLLVDLETSISTEELLKLIEFNPATRYPQQIHAILPVSGYSTEQFESLFAAVENFWKALWPSRQSCVTRHEDGFQLTLSVDLVA